MNGIIAFILSFTSGYAFFHLFTHPEKKKHLIPKIKIKNIELLPNFKIHYRKTTIWIHHWILLSVFTAGFFLIFEGLTHLILVKGIAIGGIVQGLRFKDRFNIKNPRFAQENTVIHKKNVSYPTDKS